MEKNPLIFLAVPDSLNGEIQRLARRRMEELQGKNSPEEPDGDFPEEQPGEENFEGIGFDINPSILLPVEMGPGTAEMDPEKLSWEMILSGMLRVIAGAAGNGPGAALTVPAVVKRGDIITDPGEAGIPQEWIDYYRAFVLAAKPGIFHEFTGAAIVKARNGEYGMALEINGILEGLFPGSPGVFLNKALIMEDRAAALEKNGHAAEKERSEALEAYEAALAMEPVLPDTFFNAGFFFMGRKDFARAKDCFSSYASYGEDSEFPLEIPGEKKEQALKLVKEIQSQGLDDGSFKEAYGCIIRDDDEKALLAVREFIGKYPKAWNGWFLLGWALRKLGRYKDGLEALKQAAGLGGTSGDVKNETAICLIELGDLKAARKELESALREEPENTRIISNMGVIAMKAGRKDEAEAFFRTVLELDPADPLARHFLEGKA